MYQNHLGRVFGFLLAMLCVPYLEGQVLGVSEITPNNLFKGYWTQLSLHEIQVKLPTNGVVCANPNAPDPYLKPVQVFGNLVNVHEDQNILMIDANFFLTEGHSPHRSDCTEIIGYSRGGRHTVRAGYVHTKFDECDFMRTLYFSRDVQGYKAKIVNGLPRNKKRGDVAVSGILLNEESLASNSCGSQVNGGRTVPRTAIGIVDQKTLIVATWNNGDNNMGATLREVYEFMWDNGCNSILNLDGGGSAGVCGR